MSGIIGLVLFLFVQGTLANYQITFKTGVEAAAGIAATAAVKLSGTNGQQSQWIVLTRQNIDDLKNGTDTTYTVAGDYGDLNSAEVGHTSTTDDAWHLISVTVVNQNTGTSHLFKCLCWLEPPNLTRLITISANLQWTEWTGYGPCSVTCGDGVRIRTRQKCLGPATLTDCATTEQQTQQCSQVACPTTPSGPWTAWGACSVTCGTGSQTRERTCNAAVGCEGTAPSQIQACVTGNLCPTIASGPWTDWSTCSVTCGSGTKTKSRTCDNPLGCTGTAPSTTQICRTGVLCPTIPLGPWTEWSACSKTCGGGTRSRQKTCDNTAGCVGEPQREEETCNQNVICPTVATGPWTPWSDCSVTCATGTRTRSRTCVNPVGCLGDTPSENEQCDTNVICPTTPSGQWGAWGACSVTCGIGTYTRSRTCVNPAGCKGAAPTETDQCDTNVICPTTPAGQWGAWSACSVTCGTGTYTRSRTCVNPAGCQGIAPSENGACDTGVTCPTVPAGPWGAWGTCSVTCGTGTYTRSRTCDNPVGCKGAAPIDTGQCDTNVICVTTPAGPWGAWGACSVTCGIGTYTRSRTCVNPAGCKGAAPTDTGQCDTNVICATTPAGQWGRWGTCSVTCGTGTYTRSRTCDNPAGCQGIAPSENGACDTGVTCPTVPAGPWGTWGQCSASCALGRRTRTRTCINPVGCRGIGPVQNEQCDTQVTCPTIPAGPWTAWSQCSVTCGTGTHNRSRTCANTVGCTGDAPVETGQCDTNVKCPDVPAGPWGGWSDCSVTCGNGTHTRQRTCVNPAGCKGEAPTDTGECLTGVECPFIPSGPWGQWGACSVACGSGTQTRTRTCVNPSGCRGAAPVETGTCYSGVKCAPTGPWGVWGACSVTCGQGVQIRSRTCQDAVNGCQGAAEADTQSCLLQTCDACSGTQFQCQVADGSNYCIDRTKVCDGVNDCLSGSDEFTTAGCDGGGGGGAVATASFTIPLIIVILVIIALLFVVLLIWCLCKRTKRNRDRKVAPLGSQISQASSTPMFGSFGNLSKPLIAIPPKRKTTPKSLYSPDLTRRTITQRVEAPHIIHLPGNEVIPAGSGQTSRGGQNAVVAETVIKNMQGVTDPKSESLA